MQKGILSAVGNTPLIELTRFFRNAHFRLFAKLESINPGGSLKDRAALTIINKAIEQGMLRSGGTVIESSSGNMGIGLAQVCAYLGFRFICVIDPKTTSQNVNLLKAYGAEVDLVTEPDARTGDFLQARISRVEALMKSTPNTFWPNQYANTDNPLAHHQTMQEITTAVGGNLDYVFCAASTCGTVRGCSEYVKSHNLRTRVIAVDAVGSVIFGGKSAKRLIPGHGAARRPELYQSDMVDRSVAVSDLDCIVGCRRLVRREAIMAGGSSGAVVMAVDKIKHEIPADSTCVVILADRGSRYLDTIYSDEWVNKHFGDVSHLWEDSFVATSHGAVA